MKPARDRSPARSRRLPGWGCNRRVRIAGTAGVGADGMAHRVVDVDMTFGALGVFKTTQGDKVGIGGCFHGRQGICPFGVIDRVGVVADGHEVETGCFTGSQRLGRSA